jgi:hypothetical protein
MPRPGIHGYCLELEEADALDAERVGRPMVYVQLRQPMLKAGRRGVENGNSTTALSDGDAIRLDPYSSTVSVESCCKKILYLDANSSRRHPSIMII